MAFSVVDQTITGAGQVNFGAVRQILFWAVHVTLRGVEVHEVNLASGQLYRAGHVSLGDHFTVIGGVDRYYWREPVWLFFDDNLWTPNATASVGGTAFTTLASAVKWWLSQDTVAYMFMLADS